MVVSAGLIRDFFLVTRNCQFAHFFQGFSFQQLSAGTFSFWEVILCERKERAKYNIAARMKVLKNFAGICPSGV